MAGPGGQNVPRPERSRAAEKRAEKQEAREKQAQKELEKWLARQEQRALGGGLLSGPSGGAELVNLLRSNPELAARVQAWMEANPGAPGLIGAMANAGAGGRQDQLLTAFPELFQQYVAATGKSIIYDAEGNAVRLVDPNKYYGLREGDVFTTPTLFGTKGEELPLPTLTSDDDNVNFAPIDPQALRFGATPPDGVPGEVGTLTRSQLPQGDTFSYGDIVGGEE